MRPLQTITDLAASFLTGWGPFLLLVAASLVVSYLVHRGIKALGKYDPPGERFDYVTVMLRASHPLITVGAFTVAFWAGVQWFGTKVPVDVVRAALRFQVAIFIVLAAVVVVRGVNGFLRQKAKKEPRWRPAATLGVRVADIAIYVVALLIILGQYDVEITPLLTSLGIAGLAVALALQDTLANFFAGLWIQTGKSLYPGHYIKVEDKNVEGFVVDIGWRTTKIRTLPGNVVIMPNSAVAQSTITDFWLPEPKMGTNLTVVTGFETDPDKIVPMIVEEIRAAQNEVDYILKEPEPFCRLNKRLDHGWEFWMSFWIPFYYNQWNAQGYVLNKIRKRFDKEGIRMPYPTQVRIMAQPDPSDPAVQRPRAPPTRASGSAAPAASSTPSQAGWTADAGGDR